MDRIEYNIRLHVIKQSFIIPLSRNNVRKTFQEQIHLSVYVDQLKPNTYWISISKLVKLVNQIYSGIVKDLLADRQKWVNKSFCMLRGLDFLL